MLRYRFSSQANGEPEVHPMVVWVKFEAIGLREHGWQTRQLWE
jgi:hypothetical protein